jgi:hypothetical protein
MYERCDFVDWNICDCPEIFGDIHAVIITYAAFASTFRDAVESAGYVSRRRTDMCNQPYKAVVRPEDDAGKAQSGITAALDKYGYGFSDKSIQIFDEIIIKCFGFQNVSSPKAVNQYII